MDAVAGLTLLFAPQTFLALLGGIAYGLLIGIIPGLGAGAALTLLLPFTMVMDASTAFAAIIGLMAVNTTSDTIPAVLFGVPGETSSAATILDGHAMAKQGRAKEALGASYAASMLGGIFGAVLLGVSIPVMGRLIPYIGTPELLAVCIVGLSFAASISGKHVLKGLASAGLGLLISFVGLSSQTGEPRWTFGTLYLWDGVPIIPMILGMFAVPMLADIVNQPAADVATREVKGDSMLRGVVAAGRHWFLILRSSWIGVALGAVPGIGGAVIGWIAYGSAVQAARDPEKFGTGDIRGVIAPEGSNNAKDGGSLIPVLTLGVPASAGMALVLAAFMMHGIQPGPDMLRKHLDLTYMLVWGLLIANIIGAFICLFFTRYLALILSIPPRYLVPTIMTIVFMGAFQGSQSLGDLWLLFAVGSIACFLRAIDWPLPPLVLGIILGEIIERYLFISLNLYGWSWTLRPAPLVLLLFAALVILRPLVRKRRGAADGSAPISVPATIASLCFSVVALAIVGVAVGEARHWTDQARTGPVVVGVATMVLLSVVIATSLLTVLRSGTTSAADGAATLGGSRNDTLDHDEFGSGRSKFMNVIAFFDLERDAGGKVDSTFPHPALVVVLGLLSLMLGYILAAALIGMLPAIFLFVPATALFLGARPTIGLAAFSVSLFAFIVILFNQVLALPWERPLIPQVQQFILRALE